MNALSDHIGADETVEEAAASCGLSVAQFTCDHDWIYTGTSYGGDDESYHGDGRVYCSLCGLDGDS